MTAEDLIVGALTDIGELGQGEDPSPDDLAYGLIRLNGVLDSWSTERLSLFTLGLGLITLVANVQDYTLGPSGTFTAFGRPVLIQTATIVIGGIRWPLSILTSKEWAMIPEKGLTGLLPTAVYLDQAFPNSGIHVHPIPSGTPSLEFYFWGALQQFANLGDVLNAPPGYQDALKYTLMLHLSPAYNKPIDPAILALAQQKKAAIQTLNAQILSGSFGESMTLRGPNIGGAVTAPILTPAGQGGEPGPVNF